VIVMAQTSEVVEGYHLQVGPGENVGQFLADGFEDTHARQSLDALRECFLFALGLLLRRWLVAGHAVVNFAFLGLAKIEDAASTLLPSMRTAAFVLGHSPFALAFRYCPSKSTSLAWPFACDPGACETVKRAEASRLSPQRLHLNLYECFDLGSVALAVCANG